MLISLAARGDYAIDVMASSGRQADKNSLCVSVSLW
jgi:hypothetical protein